MPPKEDYTTPGLPPPPPISKTTIPLNPLLLDIHGLDELPSPEAPVVVLWLLHPRSRTRSRMNDIAARVIHAYNTSSSSSPSSSHGLIAVSFDMPNHGTRQVSPPANESWDKGNPSHAMDMFSMIRTARTDMSSMMDLLPLYIKRKVIAHMGLGWSLGGHAIWQGYMLEPRLKAVVSVVGCPDYCTLMKGRAEKSGLDLHEAFPADLQELCSEVDPMCLLSSWENDSKGRENLEKLKEKKLLLCSGAEDPLVPYSCGKGAIDKLRGLGVEFEDKVYEGVGHRFSKDMVNDAVDFLVRNAKGVATPQE